MFKNLLTIFTLLILTASISMGQWVNQGPWPTPAPDTLKGSLQGIAVDPDGKVWFSDYYSNDSLVTADTTYNVRSIIVLNPDGTPADFSPIKIINIGGGFGTFDTLWNSTRGMRAAADGNILYCDGGSNMWKIDYKTGEGLNYAFVDISSLTAPGVATESGSIFAGPVLPGNPIKEYDNDFNYLGNVTDGSLGFSRTLEASPDGNTVYWAPFTMNLIYVYQRADEFSPFELADSILFGMVVESTAWDPKSGCLWLSAGSTFNPPNLQDVDMYGASNWTPNVWYAYDVANKAIVDSFAWVPSGGTVISDNERPRGIEFSPGGDTAYVGVFGTTEANFVQQVIRNTDPVSVTFNVNMTVQRDLAQFDPATGMVYIAGSFTDWGTGQLQLTDPDGDLTYSITVDNLEPGTRLFYKFRNGDGWENDPNREYVVRGENSETSAFYNRDLGGGIDVSLTFQCNMELEIVAGRFNPDGSDTLSVRGSHNGWSSDDMMAPTVGDPNIYEVTTLGKFFADDVISYKFAYNKSDGQTAWENDPNKEYTITNDNINNGFAVISRSFNNADLSNVTGQATMVKFIVDMNAAVDADGLAFPAIETVGLLGSVAPLAWPQGGWPDADIALVKPLTDDGTGGDVTANDGFWSVDITFPQYTILFFDYKYGANWGLPSNNGTNDNEASTGVNHTITLTTGMASATANDVWQDMSPTTLTDVVTGVSELPGNLPTEYSLQQNYPNPFNPSTTIKFDIRESGFVNLRIFDLLGQEVAVLVNEEMNAGTFEVNFDASKLTSGIYIYSLSAGDFVSTKKMMLVK